MVLGGGILPLGGHLKVFGNIMTTTVCVWEERDRGGVGEWEGAAGI